MEKKKPVFKIHKGDGEAIVSPPKSQEAVLREQIERAKQNGLNEMALFEKAYDEFREKTKELVLFEETMLQVEHIVESLQENVLKPVIQGKEIFGVPESTYKAFRKQIFQSLIKKYEGDK